MSNKTVIDGHKHLIELPSFEFGIDAALLQYTASLTQGQLDPNTAMAAGWKIQGAHEFVLQLKMLAETMKPPVPRVMESLDHNA